MARLACRAVPHLERIGRDFWLAIALGTIWPVGCLFAALLSVELFRIAVVPVTPRWTQAMTMAGVAAAVAAGAFAAVGGAVLTSQTGDSSATPVTAMILALTVVSSAGVVMYCTAMRGFVTVIPDPLLIRSWQRAQRWAIAALVVSPAAAALARLEFFAAWPWVIPLTVITPVVLWSWVVLNWAHDWTKAAAQGVAANANDSSN